MSYRYLPRGGGACRRFANLAAAVAALFVAITSPGSAVRAQDAAPPPAAAPPAASAPLPTDPIAGPIRKSDTVRVIVAGADNLSGEFRVEADGTFSHPRLGQINVAGKMQAAVAQDIARRIQQRQLLKRADVAVYIVGRKARTVTVNGAVTTQGQQVIRDGAVLSQVLENAVLSPAADLSKVVITRGDRKINVDYRRFRTGQSSDAANNPALEDQDSIYVFSAAPTEGTVRVNGEVKDSTKVLIPIATGTTVGQVLQTVGGVTSYADRSGIYITRGAERIPVPYDEILRNPAAKDIVLQNNDQINVPKLDRPRQVSVTGAVRNAVAIPLTSRLTLLDAVAAAGGAIDGAEQDKIAVRRPASNGAFTTRTYNLKNDVDASTELQDGDVVTVPMGRQRPRTDIGAVVGILSGVAVLFSTLRR
jgi:protein involved in polysaccharide export with SLBB domain